MRVNTQLLDEKIKASGYKVEFIISQLGLSKNGYYKKRNGETAFRTAEVYVLCDLLKISNEEKAKIFLP